MVKKNKVVKLFRHGRKYVYEGVNITLTFDYKVANMLNELFDAYKVYNRSAFIRDLIKEKYLETFPDCLKLDNHKE